MFHAQKPTSVPGGKWTPLCVSPWGPTTRGRKPEAAGLWRSASLMQAWRYGSCNARAFEMIEDSGISAERHSDCRRAYICGFVMTETNPVRSIVAVVSEPASLILLVSIIGTESPIHHRTIVALIHLQFPSETNHER